MAKMILRAAYLAIGGTDVSTYTSKAELKAEVEDKDVTTYGSSGWKELLPGLASGGLDLEFKQDVTDNLLDEIMWTFFIAFAVVTFEVRLSNAIVGVSNPKYTGSLVVKEWNPIQGGVGDEASVTVSYPTTGAITRAVA